MDSEKQLKAYLSKVRKRLKSQMPKVLEEIKVYEEKVAHGQLTQNPKPSPQFNG